MNKGILAHTVCPVHKSCSLLNLAITARLPGQVDQHGKTLWVVTNIILIAFDSAKSDTGMPALEELEVVDRHASGRGDLNATCLGDMEKQTLPEVPSTDSSIDDPYLASAQSIHD